MFAQKSKLVTEITYLELRSDLLRPGVRGYLDLGIPPEPECEPVSQLHKREEAEAQAQPHQSANLVFLRGEKFYHRSCPFVSITYL